MRGWGGVGVGWGTHPYCRWGWGGVLTHIVGGGGVGYSPILWVGVGWGGVGYSPILWVGVYCPLP